MPDAQATCLVSLYPKHAVAEAVIEKVKAEKASR